jgi:broad specificity phosphatase PhoE
VPHGTTELWLIRHAEVEARYQNVFGGRIDMDLSPVGHQQAAALARYLHLHPLDALYVSPMKRVQQTMAPLLCNGTPRPTVLADLREVDFGDWTGLAWEQVQERFGVSAFSWLDQLENAAIPNAESSHTLRCRVEPCLASILEKHPNQRVAILCHGGVIRMILAILLRAPLPRMAAFQIEYASLTQVRLRPLGVELQLVNLAPWRDIAQANPADQPQNLVH